MGDRGGRRHRARCSLTWQHVRRGEQDRLLVADVDG